MPLQTSLPPAPEHLLKVIRCNCQADCNIECTPACGNCRGSTVLHDNDEDDDIDMHV